MAGCTFESVHDTAYNDPTEEGTVIDVHVAPLKLAAMVLMAKVVAFKLIPIAMQKVTDAHDTSIGCPLELGNVCCTHEEPLNKSDSETIADDDVLKLRLYPTAIQKPADTHDKPVNWPLGAGSLLVAQELPFHTRATGV